MNASYDKNAAIVALPPATAGRLRDRSLRAWLAQSDLSYEPVRGELLASVLGELGLPYPESGRAALRMWGQTGDRPTKWIAGLDPVYLEARLDHLCLHAHRADDISARELRRLVDHLQRTLGGANQFGFTRLGSCGYLSSPQALATASVPAYVVDGQKPDEFLPEGDGSAAYRNLASEIEMALHDHDVNLRREANGQRPVNAMWLWGGGIAPEQTTRPQPPLFSDDPLLTGYWYSATAVAEPWLGNIGTCLDGSVAGFVAETPVGDETPERLESCLIELREALRSRRLSSLTLLFRDGLRAHVRRSHAMRVWRRRSRWLEDAGAQ
ncbi:MAG TPA: hypothetical protein PKH39_17445 [Woeseiaceae bacterium]|nr:hypothetical protein [Woeseiaceae bacterium]